MNIVDTEGLVPTIYHYEEHTGDLHVERWMDAEPTLEKIKRLRSLGFDGYNADRSMRALAEIPVTIIEQWAKEGVDFLNRDHWPEVKRRLMSPDLRGFRLDLEGNMRNGIIVKGAR